VCVQAVSEEFVPVQSTSCASEVKVAASWWATKMRQHDLAQSEVSVNHTPSTLNPQPLQPTSHTLTPEPSSQTQPHTTHYRLSIRTLKPERSTLGRRHSTHETQTKKPKRSTLILNPHQAFETYLKIGMEKRCQTAWYPDTPERGSGHRSSMNDLTCDAVILQAAASTGIKDIQLRLPRAVLWINPGQVKVKTEEGRWAESLFCSTPASSSSGSSSDDEP